MDPIALAGRLAEHPLLTGLESEDLETLARHGRIRAAAPGERLYAQGEEADELCLLLRGSAVVELRSPRGFDHELARIESGGTIGELGVLSGGQRAASVTALEPVEAFALPSRQLQALLAAGAPAGALLLERLARTVAGRLRTMNARVAEMIDEQDHPDGTVRFTVRELRERLLRGSTAGD